MNRAQIIKEKYNNVKIINGKIEYLRFMSFDDLNLEYGIFKEGWVLIDKERIYMINVNDENYIPFLKILEIPVETLSRKISECNKVLELKLDFEQIFPIINVMKMSLLMRSSYWVNLGIDILSEFSIVDYNLKQIMINKVDEKWVNQKLRHKLFAYLQKSPG